MHDRYGKIKVEDLMPDPTTVSRNVKKKASDCREMLGPQVKSIFVEAGGSITFDLWLGDHRKTNYVGITAHDVSDGKVIIEYLILW